MSFLKTWIMAVRPKTLTAAVIPIGVGTSLAYGVRGRTEVSLSVYALLSALFIQIGTNLINDALDFKKGADTSERLGPKRVTQSGLLQAKHVWFSGIECFITAALLGIPLIYAGGWPIVLIGMISLIAGYAYTGGPFPLAYVGLGDAFVLIFFGWVAVGGVYYLNTESFDLSAWVAGTQVGLLATLLIAINNLRDRETDRKANKKTLAVRLGPQAIRIEIAILGVLPFLLGGYWWISHHKWAFILPFLVLPLALRLIRKIGNTESGVIFNQFLAQGALLHLAFGILLSIGLILRS